MAETGETAVALGSWPMLYDLEIDPAESNNVAETDPEIVGRLGERFDAWRRNFYEYPRGWR
jgi:hypothetical protein